MNKPKVKAGDRVNGEYRTLLSYMLSARNEVVKETDEGLMVTVKGFTGDFEMPVENLHWYEISNGNCGITNTCSSCGEEHDPGDCTTGFNSPCSEECKHK